MTLSIHESITPDGVSGLYDSIECLSPDVSRRKQAVPKKRDEFHLLRDKLRVPDAGGHVERPRIASLIKKGAAQFPATMICGRAGTGKTAIAAAEAKAHTNVAWFTAESTDIEWGTFSKYFCAALAGSLPEPDKEHPAALSTDKTEIATFLVRCFSRFYGQNGFMPTLIVLDDIHHVFDAEWFEDFLTLALYSLPRETHLLMLCRSKPPGPLWRLRSKQMLNLLDEKVIMFNSDESAELFESLGADRESSRAAHATCFGRASKLVDAATAAGRHD